MRLEIICLLFIFIAVESTYFKIDIFNFFVHKEVQSANATKLDSKICGFSILNFATKISLALSQDQQCCLKYI